MSYWVDDFRFSLRALRRTPGFTVTGVCVLALGIALNAAVFAVVNALLFKPLGGRADGDLVGIYDRHRAQRDDYRRFSYPAYRLVREHGAALSAALAQEQVSVGVTEGGTSRRAYAALVSSNYFSTLASRPALGRDFRPDEESVSSARVAILSDSYWRRQGSDPRVLGRTLRVNGRDVTIVGIAPAGFTGATALFSPDLWLPLGACAIVGVESDGREASGCLADPQRSTLSVVARLRPGTTRAAATASLAGLARADVWPNDAPGTSHELIVGRVSRLSLGAGPSGDTEVALVMLFLSALALAVLLISSLNLANMLLARGTARHREIAVRLALGSSRWRVVRLLLIESATIAAGGAVVGLALAVAGTKLLAAGVAGALPFAVAFDAVPDARVLGAALGFALLAGAICGLMPAFTLTRRAAALSHLRDQAGQAHGRAGRMSVRNTLVVFQLATSLALLTAAGLFVRGALAAAGADPGFALEGGLVARVSPALSGYSEARGRDAYATALERLGAQPGIVSVGMASAIPFGLESDGGMVRDAARGDKADASVALVAAVSPGYFRTLNMRVVRGREFGEADERGSGGGRAVIVDQALASRLWPGADPLGQRVQLDQRGAWSEPLVVVGIVPPIRQSLFDAEAPAHLYLPAAGAYRGEMFLHARLASRSREAELAALRGIREALRQADPGLAVLDVDTLRGHRDRSVYLWIARAGAALFSLLGGCALLLAILGVYGVKSYLVSCRAKEIAIRMALGATRRDVLKLVLGDGAILTVTGLACGLAASVALSQLLASWVYAAGALNMLPLTAACAVLGATALLACYAPVRRATRQSPWTGLRAD